MHLFRPTEVLDPDFDEMGGELVLSQWFEPTPEAVSYRSEDAWRYRKRYWRRLHPPPRKPYKPRERKPKPEEELFDTKSYRPAPVLPPRTPQPLPELQQPPTTEAWLQQRAKRPAAKRDAEYAEYNAHMRAYEARRASWSNELLFWDLDGKVIVCPKPTRGMGLGTGKYLFVYADEFKPGPNGNWYECARQQDVVCLTQR